MHSMCHHNHIYSSSTANRESSNELNSTNVCGRNEHTHRYDGIWRYQPIDMPCVGPIAFIFRDLLLDHWRNHCESSIPSIFHLDWSGDYIPTEKSPPLPCKGFPRIWLTVSNKGSQVTWSLHLDTPYRGIEKRRRISGYAAMHICRGQWNAWISTTKNGNSTNKIRWMKNHKIWGMNSEWTIEYVDSLRKIWQCSNWINWEPKP